MRRARDHDFDMSQPALIVTYGNAVRKHRPLDRDVILLGRGRGCDLALVSPEVAPVHCILSRGQAGWSIRDCGSRAGTHVNGEPIDQVLLCDGDNLQVGPFCFRAHLPAGSTAPCPPGGDRAVARLRRSRRNLARLALGLRRRLRDERLRGQLQLDQMAGVLHDRLREVEERTGRLAQAKRELAADREVLQQQCHALQERTLQAERALTRRQAETEAAVQARWRQFHQLCQEAEQAHARQREQAAPAAGQLAAEAHRLDLRSRELALYAHHLHQTRLRLQEQDEQLAGRRRELERLAAPPAPRSDAPHSLERNSPLQLVQSIIGQ